MASKSTRVPGRYPATGSSPIADRIRQRRGARGLTALDGSLLHFPPFADGWNKLLGAVRNEGKLPGDIREAMILRVAVHNSAAFEWIQHEKVGREAGLTTPQLAVIRDQTHDLPTPQNPGVLSPLMAACLAFAQASTKNISVPKPVFDSVRKELGVLASKEEEIEDLLVEVAGTVATYNMVSRFLVSLDVAGKMDDVVPAAVDITEHTIPIPSTSLKLHAITYIPPNSTNRWLIFSNSLLTNTSLWSRVIPTLSLQNYNIILFDQRGHGGSSIPTPPTCTMEDLADDIATVLNHFKIEKAHAVIGVSQGGASTLQFALKYPHRANRIVVCDTQAKTPEANVKAWDDRIDLATSKGMRELAEATAGRWFPAGSPWAKDEWVLGMVENTILDGFVTGARALQSYDLLSQGLLQSKVKTLLVAGELDAGGAIPKALMGLQGDWEKEGGDVRFVQVQGCGHLPMVDGSKLWVDEVVKFLEK